MTANRSPKIRIPSSAPVDSRAGSTIAINGTTRIPSPGTPVLDAPVSTAHSATTNHPIPLNCGIADPYTKATQSIGLVIALQDGMMAAFSAIPKRRPSMKSKKALCYILAALVAGCVPVLSLQPLCTEENMTFDERLLGSWVDDVNKPRSSWEFSRLSAADPNVFAEAQKKEDRERLYRLDFKDEEDHKGVFVAALG